MRPIGHRGPGTDLTHILEGCLRAVLLFEPGSLISNALLPISVALEHALVQLQPKAYTEP